MTPILLTGASGYVGSHLLAELRSRGHRVRALVRDPGTAELPRDVELHEGDVVKGTGLREALDGVRTAYYLIHSMGGGDDFVARDRAAAVNFGEAASAAGVDLRGTVGARGLARERPHADVASEQLGDQLRADVAGGSRDEDRAGIA